LIGVSLALILIAVYLLRLIIHGPPDVSLILSACLILGPLGQGGYSLLVNGEVLSLFLADTMGNAIFRSPVEGQVLFGVCFCGAYVLWSLGICWVIISAFSIGNQLRKGRIPFSIAYW
jgi:tellurite resistance protein TehA-like permease